MLSFDAELMEDLKTAVSEACNNVVLHAYDGRPGPLVVRLGVTPDGVRAVVRDHGAGIRYVASSDRMGVGLAMISALTNRAEFLGAPDGGTEVRMTFTGPGGAMRRFDRSVGAARDGGLALDLSGDAVVTLSPVELLTGVLGRIARTLAAGARFSLDRFADVYLVTDAIAAHARLAGSASQIRFAVAAGERRLVLTTGPFRTGSGARLQADGATGSLGSPLALLADEITVESVEGGELLRVVMTDRRRNRPGQPA